MNGAGAACGSCAWPPCCLARAAAMPRSAESSASTRPSTAASSARPRAPPQRRAHQLLERSGLVAKRLLDGAPRLALREPERRQREHGITPPILARHYRRLDVV